MSTLDSNARLPAEAIPRMSPLKDTTVLVTGGGQGIGRGIALAFASAGADVVVAHLPSPSDAEIAHTVKAAIEQIGSQAFTIPMDVTDRASIRDGLGNLSLQTKRLNVVVNNAGVMQRGSGLNTTLDDFNHCYEVNVLGIWNVTQEVVPHFKAHNAGKIINICSTAGRRGLPHTPAYCASKAAAISLTQSLAAALGPFGINVNAVCPGLVRTPMSEQWLTLLRSDGDDVTDMSTYMESSKHDLPLRRHLSVADIGHAAVYLASSQAANITGQALNVDGGHMSN
jgi:NAD(P)-dependent dehydrogenase (short-subunit alcohol dehydrogenase family)